MFITISKDSKIIDIYNQNTKLIYEKEELKNHNFKLQNEIQTIRSTLKYDSIE